MIRIFRIYLALFASICIYPSATLFSQSNEQVSESAAAEANDSKRTIENGFMWGVEWGGEFQTRLISDFIWQDIPDIFNPGAPQDVTMLTDVKTDLFFDARPDEKYRVYSKLRLAYPFEITQAISGSEIQAPNLKILEMYSDFNINELLFFRIGKQKVNWGKGYFWSPADRLSLDRIDPLQPWEEREGPLAMKLMIPIDISSVSLFLLVNEAARIDESAIAPNVNLVFDALELNICGYLKKDAAQSGMVLLRATAGDFNFFAETVASWGSDRVFVKPDTASPYVSAYTRGSEFFFSGTIGTRFIIPDPEIELSCQYFLNGEGYADSDVLRNAIAAVESGDPLVSALGPFDLADFGIHNGAFLFKWSKIFESAFCASILWLGNCSDWSGLIFPSASFAPFDFLRFTFGIKVRYGELQDEYLASSGRYGIVFEIDAGSGMF